MQAKKLLAGVAASAALAAGVAIGASPGGTADHLDAPLVALDGRTDINDLYVFQSPQNPDNTVLVMTVNPAAGVISGTKFKPGADYQFYVDAPGSIDGRQEAVYSLRFNNAGRGQQQVRIGGPGVPARNNWGLVGDTIELTNGGTLTTGVFEDPFFFDLNGFQNGLAFTGDDFFAGLDVTAIVLELPTSELGESGEVIGVTAGTRDGGKQVDRMGRPGVNTVLIPSDLKDDFNRRWTHLQPDRFRDDVVGSISALSGDAEYAEALADVLIPDILTVELGNDAGFPNGRQLDDDVIDIVLGLVTNGGLATDGADSNDVPFNDTFPYLADSNG